MSNLVRSAITLLFVFGSLALPPVSPAAAGSAAAAGPQRKVKDVKVKKGPEVAARVRALRESSENVRAALKYFERRGGGPKIEESFAIYGSYRAANNVAAVGGRFGNVGAFFRPAGFAPQESRIAESNVEIIFVPYHSVDYEWQGTVIANRYDDYGNLAEQYVAESVITMPDPNTYSWDEIYEAPVYGGEVQPPVDEPGMYTDYNWGSTREQQPETYMYVAKSAGARDGAKVVKAGLQTRRARVRAWARCSFAWCGGAGVACVAVNIWNAELLAGPCFAIGCITGAIGCTWGTLWQ